MPLLFQILFEAKEGQQVPNDKESEASNEDNLKVKYPEFMISECDCIYSFEEPSPEMTKHIKPLFIKAWLNGVVLNRVLINYGAVVDIIPFSTLKMINKQVSTLV